MLIGWIQFNNLALLYMLVNLYLLFLCITMFRKDEYINYDNVSRNLDTESTSLLLSPSRIDIEYDQMVTECRNGRTSSTWSKSHNPLKRQDKRSELFDKFTTRWKSHSLPDSL